MSSKPGFMKAFPYQKDVLALPVSDLDAASQWYCAHFGMVEVEVTVDENGKVLSARATSGPPTLRDAAVEAAKHARFSPTRLSGAPVKVIGMINYNFTLP